jgi:hypothetical protein
VKYLVKEKELGPAKKNKKKQWLIQYRWKNKAAFDKFPKDWFKEQFTEEWKPLKFGSKFSSLKAAQESLNNRLKTAISYCEGSIMYNFYARDLQKEYRFFNSQTKEIVEYGNKRENTKTGS